MNKERLDDLKAAKESLEGINDSLEGTLNRINGAMQPFIRELEQIGIALSDAFAILRSVEQGEANYFNTVMTDVERATKRGEIIEDYIISLQAALDDIRATQESITNLSSELSRVTDNFSSDLDDAIGSIDEIID